MNIKETKKNIIQAGHKAVEELIKVAGEKIVDSGDDISADRLKNAAATKKLAIFDAFEILNRIKEEEDLLNNKPKEEDCCEVNDCHFIYKGVARRSFNLGYKIASKFDLSQAEASMKDGLLKISVPYAESSKPKVLKIK